MMAVTVQSRPLSVHEHISMDMLAKYGVPVPRRKVATTTAEAKKIADEFGKSISDE